MYSQITSKSILTAAAVFLAALGLTLGLLASIGRAAPAPPAPRPEQAYVSYGLEQSAAPAGMESPAATIESGTAPQAESEIKNTDIEQAARDWLQSQPDATTQADASLEVEFVSQIGGASFAVAVSGTLAYVGVGPRLVILDIATSPTATSVTFVGQTPPLPNVVRGVAVAPGGGYVYVADGGSGLRVIDVSAPGSPTEVGACATPGYAYGVAVAPAGSYVYVADGLSGLRVIDVSAPGSPTEVGAYATPGSAQGVAVAPVDSYVYVADGLSGLRVIDVSAPGSPTEVGAYDTPGYARGVAVAPAGGYVYVADWGSGLRVINVSAPVSPTEAGAYDTPGSAYGVAVAPTGGYAYVADFSGGLRVIDVSVPGSPTEVGACDTPGSPYGVAVAPVGGYAYVADGGSGLRVIDVSAPGSPTEVGDYDILGHARGVAAAPAGGYVYVADYDGGLRVIDVSAPGSPTEVGACDTPGSPYGVAVTPAGGYVYVADDNYGLRVIDVNTPDNPTEVGAYDTPGYAVGVAVAPGGGYVYVADFSGGLRVIDVSAPVSPTEVGAYDTPKYAWGVAVAPGGGYAYVADEAGGLRVIDVSAPVSPTEVGTYDTPGNALGVAVAPAGGYVYVADDHSGLRVIDVSAPVSPTEVGAYDTLGYARGVAVAPASGDVYVADWGSGLRVIDVSAPASPTKIGAYDTPGNARDVAVAPGGGYVYVADYDGGLVILRISTPQVISTAPPRNAVTATLNTTITATYDQPINPTSVTSRTFAVHGMQSGLVTATHGVANAGNTIIVTPTRPFHQGELVYAIATTRTLNISGTGPLTATQWQFNAGEVRNRCVGGFSEVYAGSLTGVYSGGVTWGDYDGDGNLDILLTGYDDSNNYAKVYQNTGSHGSSSGDGFNEVYAGSLTGVWNGGVAWGDYDNDGDLDILLTGDSNGGRIAKVYENMGNHGSLPGGGFSEVHPDSLTGVGSDSSAAWGDYDNDGDLDILLVGESNSGNIAKVYENTGSHGSPSGGGFSEVYAGSLTGVLNSSAAWGDYDNDGDLDILLTGHDDDGGDLIAKVYENTGSHGSPSGGGFGEVYAGSLTAVSNSSVAWGDYDDDGDLDILLTGHDGSNNYAKVYENTGSHRSSSGDHGSSSGGHRSSSGNHRSPSGGGFSEVYAGSLTGVMNSSVAWGDYDNDGDLDILLTGHDGSTNVAKVYENTGSHGSSSGVGFSEVYTGSLTGVENSSVAWGDYDNDGDLDILLTGSSSSGHNARLYRNDDCLSNTPPTISDVPDQSTAMGAAVGPLPFTIGDAETDAGALALAGASSNILLVPPANILFGGSGTDRSVTITPAAGLTGTASITISVSDGELAAHDAFVLAVGVNSPPHFTSTPLETANVGQTYTYSISASDADAGDALTITAPTLPGWLTLTKISTRTATLGGVPSASGDYPVVLQVTDGQASVSQPFSITALPPDGDYEPDDTCAQANFIATDGTVQVHTFGAEADEDWVAFYATAGITYVIEVRVPPTSMADVVLEIHDSCEAGGSFDDSDPAFSPDIRLSFVPLVNGQYYVRLVNSAPAVYGDGVLYHLSVRSLQQTLPSGAVILVAGRLRAGDPLQDNIHYSTDAVYDFARTHGCAPEQIAYLATDTTLDGVTGLPTAANLGEAITQWAVDKVGPERPLTLYLMDHGNYDLLYLDKPNQQWITPLDLDGWLDQLEAAVPGLKVNLVVEACYSGSFIDLDQTVSAPGRVVIASTSEAAVAYASQQGATFSDSFVNGLKQGTSLYAAFEEGKWAAGQGHPDQEPWLDGDGDGVANETEDGQAAVGRSLACSEVLPQQNWPPHVAQAEVRALSGGQGEIWARVQDDDKVLGVSVVIYPPSYPSEPGEEMIQEPVPVLLVKQPETGWYAGTYGEFAELGEYRLVVYAVDNHYLRSRPKEVTVQTGWEVYLPLLIKH